MNKRLVAVICVFFIIGIFLAACLPKLLNFTNAFTITLIFILLCLFLALISCRGGFASHRGAGYPGARHRGETYSYGSKNIARSSLKLAPLLHAFLFLSIISLGALLYLNSNIFPPNHISHTFAPIEIGAQYSAQRTPSFSSGGLHFLGKDKVKAEIIGIIKSPAETRGVYYGKVNSRYVFEVENINGLKITGVALVRIQTEKDYEYGDRLLVKGTIKRPYDSVIARAKPEAISEIASSSAKKHGGLLAMTKRRDFNYREYLENQDIFAIINASEKNVTLLSHNYNSNPVLRYAYFIREKLKNQFLENMPLETGAFMRAILLGDRSELPKKLNESFRNSGTMHILPI